MIIIAQLANSLQLGVIPALKILHKSYYCPVVKSFQLGVTQHKQFGFIVIIAQLANWSQLGVISAYKIFDKL